MSYLAWIVVANAFMLGVFAGMFIELVMLQATGKLKKEHNDAE